MKAAGKEVLAYCSSCRMDLAHLVVAMAGDRIAKAECRTCKKIHAYKAPKGLTSPLAKPEGSTSAERAANKERQTVELEWERQKVARKAVPSQPYNFKTKFAIGDKISHPQYGEGFVQKDVYPSKIQVLFQDDVRLLIHGKT